MTDPNPTMLEAAATANAAMRADVAQTKLRIRGVGDLPLDREAATWEITEEQRALRATRPRNRRWRALDAHDAAVDKLSEKQASAQARLREAEQALQEAPDHDARTLAAWLSGGERGERPVAAIYERERDRNSARLLVEAVGVELDRALERRVAHVEKHRQKMIEDARKDIDDARERMLAQARQLPASRQALLDARQALEWVAAFPTPSEPYGFQAAIALGLRAPVKRAFGGDGGRVEFTAVVRALEEDATAIAQAFSPGQKKALGLEEPRSPKSEAMWEGGEALLEWKRAEIERVQRQLGLRR